MARRRRAEAGSVAVVLPLLVALGLLGGAAEAAHIKKAEAASTTGAAPAAMRYLDEKGLEAALRSLAEETAPRGLARLFSLGRSSEGRELWALRLSAGLPDLEHAARSDAAAPAPEGPPLPGRPQVKLVANMHGDETLGRALLVRLAAELVGGWLRAEPRARRLLATTDLQLVPSLNPDGFARAKEGDCAGGGRENARGKDLNRSFPDQFRAEQPDLAAVPEVRALIDWMRRNR